MKKKYIKEFSSTDILIRAIWNSFYYIFFRYSPVYFTKYRVLILRLFGAKIHSSVMVYPSAKIWSPSNLEINQDSCIGRNVTIYNQGKIIIGKKVLISQNSHLCASSHDYSFRNPVMPLYTSPIDIEDECWICADSFIGPGVQLKKRTIIGSRGVMFKNSIKDGIYVGNPAKYLKKRIINKQ